MSWLASAIAAIPDVANLFSSDGPFGHSSEHKSKVLADYQFQLNQEAAAIQNQWNLDMWNRQNAYNSPENQVRLMQNAGLNPALLTDGSFSPAQSLQSANLQAGDVSAAQNAVSNSKLAHIQAISSVAQIGNLIAQTQNLREETRSKRIENDRALAYDESLQPTSRYYDPETGNDIPDLVVWQSLHPRQVPEVEIKPGYKNKGQLEAVIRLAESNSLIAEAKERTSAAMLQKKIIEAQDKNPQVVEALTKIPLATYQNVLKTTAKILQDTKLSSTQEGLILSQKALNEFELAAKHDTSVAGLIETFKDPSMSFTDKITSVIGLALSVIISNLK